MFTIGNKENAILVLIAALFGVVLLLGGVVAYLLFNPEKPPKLPDLKKEQTAINAINSELENVKDEFKDTITNLEIEAGVEKAEIERRLRNVETRKQEVKTVTGRSDRLVREASNVRDTPLVNTRPDDTLRCRAYPNSAGC